MPYINFESFAIALGLFFNAYQLKRNWKMNALKIELKYKERFDNLNEDRKEFHHLYRDSKITLKSLKKQNRKLYDKVINWESRYFHYEFDRFVIGHKRKVIPSYLKEAWDCSSKSAMHNHIHKQAWELEISKEHFLDKDFYDFVEVSSKKECS